MEAIIIYDSKTGTTKKLAHEIGNYLNGKGIPNSVYPVSECDRDKLESAELLLLGAWTQGLFFFAQHPGKEWKKFVSEKMDVKNKKLGFFTTYKLLTGSMYRKMKMSVNGNNKIFEELLKSRNGELTDEGRSYLDKWVAE